ncbi:MAG: hypothetical protein IPI84_14370 [Holophagaceae bacterium]|nr:hypothetical protein [Holophagaceae bacterium]
MPQIPFLGEAQIILAEDAVAHRRYKEAGGQAPQALAADIPSEAKRKPQELLIWTLVEQDRSQEALPIVQSLRPLEGKGKPSEKGLAAIAEGLPCATGDRAQAQATMKDFQNLYPGSGLLPRLELAWGRLVGRSGDAKESAQIFRKLIKDHPGSGQADDARLALASLLTDGSLPDIKDLPSAESLLAEVRRAARACRKGLPCGGTRLFVGKSQWEEALNLVDRMDAVTRETQPDVKKLWTEAWRGWVAQRLEKGFPGELLARLKKGTFAALDAPSRIGVAEPRRQGLLDLLPRLLIETPSAEKSALTRAALAKVQPEAQPQAVLRLLPTKGESPDEALMRAWAEALEHWGPPAGGLGGSRPGPGASGRLCGFSSVPESPETPPSVWRKRKGLVDPRPRKGRGQEPLAILVAISACSRVTPGCPGPIPGQASSSQSSRARWPSCGPKRW